MTDKIIRDYEMLPVLQTNERKRVNGAENQFLYLGKLLKGFCSCVLGLLVFLGVTTSVVYILVRSTGSSSLMEIYSTRYSLTENSAVSYTFPAWNQPFPCVDPQSNVDSDHPSGLFYIKMYKAASSTLSGVAMMIADNKKLPKMTGDHDRCAVQAHHLPAREQNLVKRNVQKSYLWSFIRDPKTRAISSYFYFKVFRNGENPHESSFRSFLKLQRNSHFEYLRTKERDSYNMSNAIETATSLLKEYNFIGLVERLDESLVVFRLLLGLNATDILYLSSKRSGSYSSYSLRNGTRACGKIPMKFTTPDVDEYVASDNWYANNAIDYALHSQVEEVLEATIESIGRDKFDKALKEHRTLLDLAEEKCRPEAKYPCSNDGVYGTSNCYWNDIGCAHECLQRLGQKGWH